MLSQFEIWCPCYKLPLSSHGVRDEEQSLRKPIFGLAAIAAGLLAAWVTTMPPSEMPPWLPRVLLALFLGVVAATTWVAAYGIRRFFRVPARIVFVDGVRVEIIPLVHAVDYFRARTKYGEYYEDLTEEGRLRLCHERFRDENASGNLAFFGRLPHASSFRSISVTQIRHGYLDFGEAVLFEDANKRQRLRDDLCVDYKNLLDLTTRWQYGINDMSRRNSSAATD